MALSIAEFAAKANPAVSSFSVERTALQDTGEPNSLIRNFLHLQPPVTTPLYYHPPDGFRIHHDALLLPPSSPRFPLMHPSSLNQSLFTSSSIDLGYNPRASIETSTPSLLPLPSRRRSKRKFLPLQEPQNQTHGSMPVLANPPARSSSKDQVIKLSPPATDKVVLGGPSSPDILPDLPRVSPEAVGTHGGGSRGHPTKARRPLPSFPLKRSSSKTLTSCIERPDIRPRCNSETLLSPRRSTFPLDTSIDAPPNTDLKLERPLPKLPIRDDDIPPEPFSPRPLIRPGPRGSSLGKMSHRLLTDPQFFDGRSFSSMWESSRSSDGRPTSGEKAEEDEDEEEEEEEEALTDRDELTDQLGVLQSPHQWRESHAWRLAQLRDPDHHQSTTQVFTKPSRVQDKRSNPRPHRAHEDDAWAQRTLSGTPILLTSADEAHVAQQSDGVVVVTRQIGSWGTEVWEESAVKAVIPKLRRLKLPSKKRN
jgi:hypothetical protein